MKTNLGIQKNARNSHAISALQALKKLQGLGLIFCALLMGSTQVWGMTTSDIESSAATSLTDGASYVIATAYNGKYLTSEAYADWGRISTDINDAAIFTVHGSATGFYLTCSSGTMVVAASAKFVGYNTSSTNNLQLGGTGTILSLANSAINLRENSTGLRWYNGTTGNSVYLYKITSKFTITYNAGSGTCKASDSEASAGSGITLASATPSAACSAGGWVFAGWKQTSALSETTTIPTLIPGGSVYHPHSSETLYAVYRLGDVYTIDFESTADTYSDWTFTRITPQSTNAYISASGSYIGLTTSTNPNSVETKSKIAAPQAIRFKISKTTTNTSNSTWQVYTSDGSGWVSRKSQDAKSMSQGQWVEVTQDLSSYTNVYVKIEYSGSTAIRAIDDVVLSCATYNSNPSCCDKLVALSAGTETNATISSFSPSSVPTCSSTAADRNVTITVAAATGYEFTSSARLTYSGDGSATYVSGPTGTGPYTFVYQFAQNNNGSGTFSVTSATPKTFTITYLDQGGGAFTGTQAGAPTTHTYGTATTLKIPTKFGHTFGGWYTASDCASGAVGTSSAASLAADGYTANITLYAKWTEKALTNYRTTCCTDWSTPTVSYSSSLAINASEGVTISSGTTHGAVTYESSDEDVLTVDADGTIHAVGAGTAHIIATWAGETISSTTYCEKSANSNDVTVSGIQVTGTTPVNFGQVYQNTVIADKTIYVTGLGLANDITPSLPAGSPFSFSPASLAANSSGATLTISANTATLGNYNQTLTLTSGAFSTTVTVKMEVIAMPSCEFVDNLHNLTVDASSVPLSSYALTAAQGTAVVFPTLANQVKGASTCEDQHYRFVGWTTSDNNTDPEDHLVTSHTLANGDDITYYAVWADGVAGVSYTKLTSSTFKTSPAKYVLGGEDGGTAYYLSAYSSTNADVSWGTCSSSDAPIQFTLSGTAAALVAQDASGNYLAESDGAKKFRMNSTSSTVELKSDGTIETEYFYLRYNYNNGAGGLRLYDKTSAEPAYFYEVEAGGTVSYRTSCCADKVEAPTITATQTSTSITLNWSDETGATGWEVSWNGGAFGSPSGTRTHTVSGLTPNTTYTWQVRATYTEPKCGADIASGSTTTNQVYHVTYAKGDEGANCNASNSTTDATGYEAGATVTLQANGFTLVGHVFAGWTEDDDDITISSNQFTMPDHDVVITASWTAKVDKYFDRMHDQTDALHGGIVETEGTNEGKYYIAKTGCNYSIPTAVDSNTGDACQTSHYKLQGWIAASYVASDGTITPANLAAHLFPPTGTKTATGATYYAVWAEVTE